MRVDLSPENDVCCRQALRTHFLPLDQPKCELRKVEKAMFQGLGLILTSLKCDLHELVKAMIQVLASHFELIFCLLTSPKYNLGEVEKAFFSSGRMAL